MFEVTGDLWTYPAQIRVITTNGFVRNDGRCVMGRGCALEATQRYPGIDTLLGYKIKTGGNQVHVLKAGSFEAGIEALVSFPVKHKWFQKADFDLIKKSALELRSVVSNYKHTVRVVLPRPGCGNGQLVWCNCEPGWPVNCLGVKHILAPILDERFHVITFN